MGACLRCLERRAVIAHMTGKHERDRTMKGWAMMMGSIDRAARANRRVTPDGKRMSTGVRGRSHCHQNWAHNCCRTTSCEFGVLPQSGRTCSAGSSDRSATGCTTQWTTATSLRPSPATKRSRVRSHTRTRSLLFHLLFPVACRSPAISQSHHPPTV